MATSKKSVADLLAQATVKWICPLTKKQFDAEDTLGITRHKEALLAEDARKKEAAALAKTIKEARQLFQREIRVSGSLAQYVQALNHFIKSVYPDSPEVKISVERIACEESPQACIISVINPSEMSPQALQLIGAVNLKNAAATRTCRYDGAKIKTLKVIKGFVKDSELFLSIHNWQCRSPGIGRKLSKEDNEFLGKNPTYAQAKEELKQICKQLSSLKEAHAKALLKCEDIRKEVFAEDIFKG